MDSLIAAAARALATGDVLGALQHVALRDDPAALALRGIAMARLGELPRARALLRRAARGFGAHEALARARCVVAEAEVALAQRDLSGATRGLAAAAAVLDARGDRSNAQQARLIAVRRELLLGRLAQAADTLAAVDARGGPPALAAVAELTRAELALRWLRTAQAEAALALADAAAARAGLPELQAEVAEARSAPSETRSFSCEGERGGLESVSSDEPEGSGGGAPHVELRTSPGLPRIHSANGPCVFTGRWTMVPNERTFGSNR